MMRPLLGTTFSIAAALAVMALAFWAYRENYATQQALKDQRAIQREIGALRDSLAMQRAEWAWLNRPERLSALTAASFDTLGLLPMTGTAYTPLAAVPLPTPPEPLVPDDTVTDTAAGPRR
jgi:hypothetical protein